MGQIQQPKSQKPPLIRIRRTCVKVYKKMVEAKMCACECRRRRNGGVQGLKVTQQARDYPNTTALLHILSIIGQSINKKLRKRFHKQNFENKNKNR